MKNPFQIESSNQCLKPFRAKQKSKLDTSRRSSGPLNTNPSSLAGGHVVKNRYGPSEKSFIDKRKPTSMKSIEPHITDNYSTNQSRHDMRRSKDSSGARERNRFCGRCFPKITEFYKTRRLCILISYFILVTIIFGTCYGIIYWLYTTGPKQAKTCFVDPCGQFQPRTWPTTSILGAAESPRVLCIQNAADPDNPGYAITGPIQAQSAQVDYFDCAVDQ